MLELLHGSEMLEEEEHIKKWYYSRRILKVLAVLLCGDFIPELWSVIVRFYENIKVSIQECTYICKQTL